MYSKLALVATAALAIFATAAPAPLARRDGGNVVCCDTKTMSDSPQALSVLGPLSIVLDVIQEIGINCLPISVLGGVW